MINKNLFKKNYLLFISIFISICFCFILVSSLKVNAYHLDEQTGNLVSDNLIDNSDLVFYDGQVYNSSGGVDYWSGYYRIDNYFDILPSTTYYFKIDNSFGWSPIAFYDVDKNFISLTTINSDNISFTSPIDAHFIRISSNISYDDIDLRSILSLQTSPITTYEPYGKIYFYGQQSYDDAYQMGYDNGYNDGLIAGNTAPSFYFDSVKSLIDLTDPFTGYLVPTYVDMSQYVTGYNSIINISEVLGHTYGSGFRSQYYTLMLRLVNPIALNDVLKFTFSDISSIDGFSSRVAISFSSSASCYDPGTGGSLCPVYASFTYNELLQNDFTITLEDFGSLEDVSSIDMVNVNLYYNGSHSFGLLTLEDTTLIGNINTDFELGYRVGFVTGEQSGFIKGETIGYDNGYNDGYRTASQVVSKPGNNTLAGMVGRIIETPVNMFIDIFNFEFLGINLVAFFFSLLTLLIVVWLIKYLK